MWRFFIVRKARKSPPLWLLPEDGAPSTGGIGTKAFTAAGIALMGAAAGAVIVTGKKKKKEQ